ncbi:uncharacterized protein LOC120331258 [Styela clava]
MSTKSKVNSQSNQNSPNHEEEEVQQENQNHLEEIEENDELDDEETTTAGEVRCQAWSFVAMTVGSIGIGLVMVISSALMGIGTLYAPGIFMFIWSMISTCIAFNKYKRSKRMYAEESDARQAEMEESPEVDASYQRVGDPEILANVDQIDEQSESSHVTTNGKAKLPPSYDREH